MISIVIPSRNEQFLNKTVEDLLQKAKGEIEIIVILDGYWCNPPLRNDDRIKIIHRGESRGMRNGINSAVAIAQGDYILKTDAHCLWDEGFDVKLMEDIKDNWVVVPRRKRLDAENWCIQENGKPDIDYMYLSYPDDPNDYGGAGLNGKNWDDKNRDPKFRDILIDDLLSSQGSAWFMKKTYFYKLELMDELNYGTFWNEMQEIGLKCWLSGGQMKINKKTWYAHLHKGKKYGRGYNLQNSELIKGATFTKGWFGKKMWHKQKYPLSWLIEKFMPMPTWDQEKLNVLKEKERESFDLIPIKEEYKGDCPELNYVLKKWGFVGTKPHQIPNTRRDDLAKLFHELGYKVGVEIGVERGRFSQQIMQHNPTIKMYGVDHYGDYAGRYGKNQEANFNEAKERLKDYDYTFLKMTSMEALEEFADESIDFVYIDGDHEFSKVACDLVGWERKVRKGGIVAGHDYSQPRHRNRDGSLKDNRTHHVQEAVDGYMKGYQIDPWFVLGRTERVEGEARELLRSWFFVKK